MSPLSPSVAELLRDREGLLKAFNSLPGIAKGGPGVA